jgi:hypothetical protein
MVRIIICGYLRKQGLINDEGHIALSMVLDVVATSQIILG